MTAAYLDHLRQAVEAGSARTDERALSYILGLGLDPVPSLELAREALRRASKAAGPSPDFKAAMAEVRNLLREKGLDPEGRGDGGSGFSSTPPLNRRPMVAEEMDLSLIGRLRRRRT